MKKVLTMLLALCMLLSLAACSAPPTEDELQSTAQSTEANNESKAEEPTEAPTNAPTEAPTTEPEEPSDPYEITFSSVKTHKNSIGTIWAQAIVEIENTGSSDLFLESGSCDFEDMEGNLVASKDMSVYPQIIAPGEKAYYYEETILDALTEPADLKIIPRPEIMESTTEHITYSVTDISITDNTYGGVKVIGRVENTTEAEESMIYVAITLFNEAAEPIGLVFTILTDDLAPGEKVGFEATSISLPDEVTADSVASYTAVAYPHQFQFDF